MSSQLGQVIERNRRSSNEATNNIKDFAFLHLDDRIIAGLSSAGYTMPRPIQLNAIPLCRTGIDVFLQGEAGAGKTLVFSILALTAVLEDEDLNVMIVAPAREGAFEIYNTICDIGSKVANLRCECFIGGMNYTEDIPKAIGCKIAVGTPGRLLHLIQDDKLRIHNTRLFIIDDFDELQDMDMKPAVREIFDLLPDEKQTVVTSPTCCSDTMELASKYLKPEFQTLCCENEPSLLSLDHYHCIVPGDSLMESLSYRRRLKILKKILLKLKFSQCIVFSNLLKRIEMLCIDIKAWGLSVVSTSAEKDQLHRLRVAQAMKENKHKILVSTDMSSRGLDGQNVDLIINFDVPYSCRVYLRRCGRAGRFGAKCSSITFVSEDQIERFNELENEGQFKSYSLPKPIPEYLCCDISTSIESSMQCVLRTDYKSKQNLASSTELNKYETVNLEKTATLESLPLITNKTEEQTVDIQIANTAKLVEDLEVIKVENKCAGADPQLVEDFEVIKGENKSAEDDPHLFEDFEVTKVENKCAKNDPRLVEDFEVIRVENTCAEDYQDTPKIEDIGAGLLPSFEETAAVPGSLSLCSASGNCAKEHI